MIKKVKVEQLKPGVFIHSFDCGWMAHRFIKCMGIYPMIGTVVELESGMIGVVTDSTDILLRPVVTAVYNKKKGWPISPRTIDLSRQAGQGGEDRIVSYGMRRSMEHRSHEGSGIKIIALSRGLQVLV